MRRLPRIGEFFQYGGWRFEVIDVDGRRIDKSWQHRARSCIVAHHDRWRGLDRPLKRTVAGSAIGLLQPQT